MVSEYRVAEMQTEQVLGISFKTTYIHLTLLNHKMSTVDISCYKYYIAILKNRLSNRHLELGRRQGSYFCYTVRPGETENHAVGPGNYIFSLFLLEKIRECCFYFKHLKIKDKRPWISI